MFKLIKLEIKKLNLIGYIKPLLITTLVIIGLAFSVIVTETNEGNILPNFNPWFYMIDVLVRNTYIIFASVLLSKFLIDEYKNKTISLMFMYPISRKKIILSKLIIVIVFTFVAIIISNIVIGIVIYVINYYAHVASSVINIGQLLNQSIIILVNAINSSFMILIPLYFGMRKKSVPTTIISAVIIVLIIELNNGGLTLSTIIYMSLSLAVIGILIAYLTIKKIEHVDVT